MLFRRLAAAHCAGGLVLAVTLFGLNAVADDTPPTPTVTAAGKGDVIGLHRKLTIEAIGLPAWAEKNEASKIVLYLDGMPLRGIKPRADRLQPILTAPKAAHLQDLLAQKATARSKSEDEQLRKLLEKYKVSFDARTLADLQDLANLSAKSATALSDAEKQRLDDLKKKFPTQPKADELLTLQQLLTKPAPLTTDQETELATLQTGSLEFVLERVPSEPDNIAAWNALMSRPTGADFNGHSATARVSLGYNEHLFPLAEDVRVPVQKLSKIGVWLVILLCLGLVWAIIELAHRSNLLRDSGPEPPAGVQRPFSLARTQMAFWFVLVVTSYVSIWLATGALDTLTSSVLGLIGISAATGFASVIVDNSKRQAAQDALKARRDEKDKYLKDHPVADQANPPDATLADFVKKIADAQSALDPIPSQGFLLDILTDDTGVSLHRMQIAVWTVVAGIIFVAAVYNSLSMPEFSDTLLGLMGISGGTYIGFKIPEKQTASAPAAGH